MKVPGPEKDLLNQVRQALKDVSAPVFFDGHKHNAVYPQVIIDFSNDQERPDIIRTAEVIKPTISADVYTNIEDVGTLLDISREVIGAIKSARCQYWASDFDNYSGRILDDESNDGAPLKRNALLFDFFIYSIRKG